MIYYIGILFLCFLSFFFFNRNKLYTNLFIILLGFFLCFGYMTGTDWRSYEPLYESIKNKELGILEAMLFVEPGYFLYNYIFGLFNINFWDFFIFTKVILYIIFIRSLLYFCPSKNFFLALLFFVAWYAYFLFIDNPMRNLIAVGIFLGSIQFLIKRKFIPYLILTILAISFHFSAIIMLLLYWISNKDFKTKNLIIAYVILNIILLSPHLLYTVLDFVFSEVPLIKYKIEAYSNNLEGDGGGKIISFGMLIHNIFFILFIISRKKIENIPYGKMVFIFSILYLIFFRLGLTITVMGRFQLYVAVFYSISVGYVICNFTDRSKYVYVFYVFLVSVIPCISYLVKDFRYVPYTNYLFYSDHEMTFDQRDRYNKNNSPYKTFEN